MNKKISIRGLALILCIITIVGPIPSFAYNPSASNPYAGTFKGYTAQEQAELDEKAAEIYEYLDLEHCDSMYQRYLRIFVWVASNITYDGNRFGGDDYAALLSYHTGVCEDYAKIFCEIVNNAPSQYGLSAEYIANSKHAWNIVKYEDGFWYAIDCSSGVFNYKKFMYIDSFDNRGASFKTSDFINKHPMAAKAMAYAPISNYRDQQLWDTFDNTLRRKNINFSVDKNASNLRFTMDSLKDAGIVSAYLCVQWQQDEYMDRNVSIGNMIDFRDPDTDYSFYLTDTHAFTININNITQIGWDFERYLDNTRTFYLNLIDKDGIVYQSNPVSVEFSDDDLKICRNRKNAPLLNEHIGNYGEKYLDITPIDEADGYVIQYNPNLNPYDSNWWTSYKNVSANNTSVLINNLIYNDGINNNKRSFDLRVKAYKLVDNEIVYISEPSERYTFEMPPQNAIYAPENIKFTISNNDGVSKVNYSWDVGKYKINNASFPSRYYTLRGYYVIDNNNHYKEFVPSNAGTLPNIQPNTNYQFQVQTIVTEDEPLTRYDSAVGYPVIYSHAYTDYESIPSDIYNVSTYDSNIRNLNITTDKTANNTAMATISWQCAVSAYGYNIYQNNTLIANVPASQVSYTVTGLEREKEYSFTIVDINANGTENSGVTQKIMTPDLGYLDDVQNIQITQNLPYSLSLSFNSTNKASGYDVQYKEVTNNIYNTIRVTNNKCVLDNVIAGKEYDIRVRAYRTKNGNTIYSNSWTSLSSPIINMSENNFVTANNHIIQTINLVSDNTNMSTYPAYAEWDGVNDVSEYQVYIISSDASERLVAETTQTHYKFEKIEPSDIQNGQIRIKIRPVFKINEHVIDGAFTENSVFFNAITGYHDIDGKKYAFDINGNIVASGWCLIDNQWYYFTNVGALTSWFVVGGKWYYSDSTGAMQIGWVKSGNAWYYMNKSGAMVTGWQKVGNTWYYFNKSGAMATGWQKIGSTWYYFNNSGAMVTGWQKVGSSWYYFQSSGAMQTGWLKSGGKWYYFNASGAMLANTSQRISGKTYKFNSSGACTNP